MKKENITKEKNFPLERFFLEYRFVRIDTVPGIYQKNKITIVIFTSRSATKFV